MSSEQVRRSAIVAVLLVIGALLAGCGPGGDSSTQQPAETMLQEEAPTASVTTNPPDRAVDVSPLAPITVTAGSGKLDRVTLSTDEGVPVPGGVDPDGKSWQTTAPLSYAQTYTINAVAKNIDGWAVNSTSTFNTLAPRAVTFPSVNPLEGQTVGVGQPLAIYFDESIADKRAAEDSITVTTNPPVEGAFYWFSDQEVHWRPQQFWAPGTQVGVDIKTFGKDLGNGVYGEKDRLVKFTIGNSFIARADGSTHQMSVEINGQVVRTMPISMGDADFPSNNGVHVVTERHPTKIMDSTTFGLQLTEGGYITEVKWATRISNGGEFVHSAPWSVGDQGRRNVSHGCINLSPENAKWFFDNVKKGDVVITTNTGGPNLRSWDGFGDWQIPWGEWLTGGAE
ncbi:MAG: Ig-like domain-containing protein [Pseudonocardiaceae bacterium]